MRAEMARGSFADTMRRSVLGALTGAAAAAASALVAHASGENTSVIVAVLAIAMVGLLAGTLAALWTYGVSGLLLVALAVPPAGADLDAGDAFRVAAFVVGSPLVILLILRAEERHRRAADDRDESVAAERLAVGDRRIADEARAELSVAVQALERERGRLAEVAEAIPEALIVYDQEGLGTYANRAALRLFGRSFYETPLADWGRRVEPRDERGTPLTRNEWPQVRAQHEVFHGRMVVRLPMSGRDLMVDVEGTPMPEGGCVLLLRDIGKEVDERRRLSRFASFVAHELRNPLAVAKARIELATREDSGSNRARMHEERALESVDAAIAILERLELFSRAEAGHLETTPEPFDLLAAVDAAVERLRANGSDREVRVVAPRTATIMGDRGLSEQAITNLLTNADRYSQAAEPIDLEIRRDGRATVRIADAGPGIPDEVADLLFRERVSSGRGLGLGLYIVNAAMVAQGGTVAIEQRRPRAVFLLTWPDADES